jgi:hypothetical protein
VVDCTSFERGKRGFVTKLLLATGEVVWTHEMQLAEPDLEMFVPTAITANDQHVWVAVTYQGTFDAWGEPLTSGPSPESVVLRLAL